jgi:hypothetical protein
VIAPKALRLRGPREGARPPFGLSGFSDDAADVAVALDLDPDDDSVAVVAAALPSPAELPPNAIVLVLPTRPPPRGLLARLRTPPPISRAHRASALLARGYVDIEADVDPKSGMDLVWARRPDEIS